MFSKIHKNERGFSVVEALLILVLLGLIGGVGWYVWTARGAEDAKIPENTITTKNTVEYTNDVLGVTLSHPKTWGDAIAAEGPLVSPQSGEYTQITFSKEKRVNINLVKGGYFSPLDGCISDTVLISKHTQLGTQASVIGWEGSDLKALYDMPDTGDTVLKQSKARGGNSNGWTEIKKDNKVLSYRKLDDALARVKATTSEDSGCGDTITQAQADEANAYLTIYHFALNFTNSKVKGVNGQFDTRQGDDETVRNQLVDTLNTLK